MKFSRSSVSSSVLSFSEITLPIVVVLIVFGVVVPAVAIEVVAEGRSPIGGDLTLAQQAAAKNAVRNAVNKFGSRVKTSTTVTNGSLKNQTTEITAQGKVSSVKILNEFRDGDVYVVRVKANIESGHDCRVPENNRYHKSVLVTRLPLLSQQSAVAGQLGDVESKYSKVLRDMLHPAQRLHVQVDDTVTLNVANDLTMHPVHLSTRIQHLAEKYRVQFVMAGEIIDMSMLNPEAYFHGAGSLNTIKNVFKRVAARVRGKERQHTNDRLYAFRLSLYDGYSGEEVFSKRYDIQGRWDADYGEVTGFGSPRFWSTHYGQQVKALTATAVQDVGAKVNCQPFILPLDYNASEKLAYLMVGANSGVSIGDTFDVYARGEARFNYTYDASLGLYQLPDYKTLHKQQAQLVVKQVYPKYSAAGATQTLRAGKRYVAVFW